MRRLPLTELRFHTLADETLETVLNAAIALARASVWPVRVAPL